jgi:hypothetical protein
MNPMFVSRVFGFSVKLQRISENQVTGVAGNSYAA